MSLAQQTSIETVGEQIQLATEAASVAVGPWVGKGDKNAADQAAVDAITGVLIGSSVLSCEVIIGEGDKDEAPQLAHGLRLGQNMDVMFDLAVDPLEGTTSAILGEPGAMSLIALGQKGSFPKWADIHYMTKIAVGPEAAKAVRTGDVRLGVDPRENLRFVASALGRDLKELRVAVLRRDRNQHIIDAIRHVKAQAIILERGDVLPALQAGLETGAVDMLFGSGGAPEAVLTAAALATMGGEMQAMWDPQTPAEEAKAQELEQLGLVFDLKQLVGEGEIHFSATGITKSPLLGGSSLQGDGSWQPGETLLTSRPALAGT